MRNLKSLPRLNDPDATLAETMSLLTQRGHTGRRKILQGIGGAAMLASPLGAWAACTVIPAETGGPYPGDGTNGPNVLTQSGIVRSDIRASFGSAGTTVAGGTPLTITLQLTNTNASCAPLVGYAVYLWHCDASGRYSMYTSGVTTQNYLRGVQVSDSSGKVTFTTIFPAAYSGRWPHIHFEIYSSVAQAVSGTNAVRTSQLALPDASCRAVFAQSALYPGSLANHNQTSLASDNVFGNDSAAMQLATVTGSVAAGYAGTLEVGIAGSAVVATQPDISQQGLSGMWYEPASSGQGLAIEVYPDTTSNGRGFLQGGWFTFDAAPAGGVEKQRWYTFGGAVLTGATTATLPMYLNAGGNFNAAPATSAQLIGTATVNFSSCSAGQLAYALTDGSGRSGTVPLTRLTPNVACATTNARLTNADFALSGNWYSPATSGQGFIIEVNPNVPVVFFAWYTYAVNGQALTGATGQRWFTGQGAYAVGSRAIAITLYQTSGGVFDTDTPAAQTTAPVGTAMLTFQSCSSATLAFTFTAGATAGQSGTIALSRTGSVPAGCIA